MKRTRGQIERLNPAQSDAVTAVVKEYGRKQRTSLLRSVSTLLWRETSISLNTEAPLSAALVKNPDRRLCPEKSAGSWPAFSA